MISLIYFVIFILLTFTSISSEICINLPNLESYEHHLACTSPYRFVANNTFGKLEFEGCTPEKLWMVVRHGTRTPSSNTIQRMKTRLPQIRNLIFQTNSQSDEISIRLGDLDVLKQWESLLPDDDAEILTYEGEEEMIGLAERMQSRFPTLLSQIYSNTSYQFRFTNTRRTNKSAKSFAVGLFGRQTVGSVWFPSPTEEDLVLRFYKMCKHWQSSVKKNSKTRIEYEKFKISEVTNRTVDEVNKRLGFDNSTLNFSDIKLIYTACAYETAWNEKQTRSPWCSVLSVENFKILEYLEDLAKYWTDGYASEVTYRQACPAFKDFISRFTEQTPYPKATVYFTHSGTLLKMYAHLGLYRDLGDLTAFDFDRYKDKRKWRTGVIDTFGSNLAFVLHNCDGLEKVLLLHQEQIIRWPSCPESDLCELDRIIEHYKSSINDCDFDEICQNNL